MKRFDSLQPLQLQRANESTTDTRGECTAHCSAVYYYEQCGDADAWCVQVSEPCVGLSCLSASPP